MITPLIVGSRALAYFDNRFYRPCHDWDVYLPPDSEEVEKHGVKRGEYFELSVMNPSERAKWHLWNYCQKHVVPSIAPRKISFLSPRIRFLPPPLVYAIKYQQLYYDIHWGKTMEDVLYMEHFYQFRISDILRDYPVVANLAFFSYLEKPALCTDTKCPVPHGNENTFVDFFKSNRCELSQLSHAYRCHMNRKKQKWVRSCYYTLKWLGHDLDDLEPEREAHYEIDQCLFVRKTLENDFLPYDLILIIQEYIENECLEHFAFFPKNLRSSDIEEFTEMCKEMKKAAENLTEAIKQCCIT